MILNKITPLKISATVEAVAPLCYYFFMAKVSYLDMLPAEELAFYKNLQPGDRFTHSHVRNKNVLFSRKSVRGLTARSLLPQIAEAWNLLSPAEKTAWSNAGAVRGLNGYRLFVADKSARIKNGLSGNATPSLLHQSWFGALTVTAPASELKIAQLHPRSYWVSQPWRGHKGMRVPVLVTESFLLPLVLSLNYKADLTSVGDGSFAKLYADVWYSYQGQDLIQRLTVPLDLSSSWKTATATLSSLSGIVIGYTLYFHLYNVTGTLYIDNVKATHSTQNWVRDTYCDDIEQGFTKAFYQIPDHWVAVTLPDGADFESVYQDV